jgi:nitroreductase
MRCANTWPTGANLHSQGGHTGRRRLKRLTLLWSSVRGVTRASCGSRFAILHVFRARLHDFGARYFASLGIERSDAAARTRQTERNYSFFGAPVGLIFSIDRRLKPHSWIDLFAQSVMIAATARGIDTCPQVAFAPFHDEIASHLQMPPEEITAFGMSMGYGDLEAAVNQTSMPRERRHDFAPLLGFSP